jgi:8-oxo-dGTP pyrophosphatase MutT (NUDIX family)
MPHHVAPTHREHVALALSLVPSHRDTPRTPEELARSLAAQCGLGAAESLGVVSAVLGLLDLFGALRQVDDGVQLASQMPVYLARSLAWFAEQGLPAIDGWRRDTLLLSERVERHEWLDHAPHVLAALETRRMALARAHNRALEPTRHQAAVLVLIDAEVTGERCYLHQFDARADQFQLIGGRMEPDETPEQTALRETLEEVGPHQPATPDVALTALFDGQPALETDELSATYGALTRYTFYAFRAAFAAPLTLGPHDRWVTRSEMLAGRTYDGKKLGTPRLAAVLAARDEL